MATKSVFSMFTVHPRKRVSALPDIDWAGRPYPTRLEQVYSTCSEAKWAAYVDCVRIASDLHARKFRIASHNSFKFVVMFEFPHPETGELMVARITSDYKDAWFIE